MNKKMIIASGLVAVSVAGIAGVTMVSAASSRADHKAAMAKSFAQKFNLNEADVQKFMDEQHATMQADHAAEMKTRLDQAVKDGKISQAQEDQLVAKQKEMQNFMATLAGKTDTERHAAMKAKMDEFQKWATDNKIPTDLMGRGMGMGGHGRGHGMGGMHSDTETNDGPDGDADDVKTQ